MKKLMIILLSFLLVGCNNEKENDSTIVIENKLGDSYYSLVSPYQGSLTREYHSLYSGTKLNFKEVSRGTQLISLDYFSNKNYYLQEGQLLNMDDLRTLLARESDSNAFGTNPIKGEKLAIEGTNLELSDLVVVNDIIEQNYMQLEGSNFILGGISLAIVLNSIHKYTSESNIEREVTISDDQLYRYANEASLKIERYLRQLDGVDSKTPILITYYKTNSSDSYLPGNFIGKAYLSNKSPKFETIDEKWLFFPSDAATKQDTKTTENFEMLKRSLYQFVPESVGVIGRGKYLDGSLNYLALDIHVQTKTYSETVAIISYVAELIKDFYGDYEINIKVISQDDIEGVVYRKANSDDITTQIFY